MKHKIVAILGMLIVAAVAVNAFGPYGNAEEVHSVTTFDELQAFREETGRKAAPWVQSEEDFAEWQETHASGEYGPENCPYAEEGECPYAEQGGRGQGQRRSGKGQGQGMRGASRDGGCPYMQ
jgi:hypothetical protein